MSDKDRPLNGTSNIHHHRDQKNNIHVYIAEKLPSKNNFLLYLTPLWLVEGFTFFHPPECHNGGRVSKSHRGEQRSYHFFSIQGVEVEQVRMIPYRN